MHCCVAWAIGSAILWLVPIFSNVMRPDGVRPALYYASGVITVTVLSRVSGDFLAERVSSFGQAVACIGLLALAALCWSSLTNLARLADEYTAAMAAGAMAHYGCLTTTVVLVRCLELPWLAIAGLAFGVYPTLLLLTTLVPVVLRGGRASLGVIARLQVTSDHLVLIALFMGPLGLAAACPF